MKTFKEFLDEVCKTTNDEMVEVVSKPSQADMIAIAEEIYNEHKEVFDRLKYK
jgi:hypothetical protein